MRLREVNNPYRAMPPRLANRRDFLSRTGMGFALLGLRGVMAEPNHGVDLPDPQAPSGPHFKPKAKRVIHIFMNSGLSHVDSFDVGQVRWQTVADAKSRDRTADRCRLCFAV